MCCGYSFIIFKMSDFKLLVLAIYFNKQPSHYFREHTLYLIYLVLKRFIFFPYNILCEHTTVLLALFHINVSVVLYFEKKTTLTCN